LANVKSDQYAQLRSVAAGIDPLLVKEVLDDLQQQERQIRRSASTRRGSEQGHPGLVAIRRLREHADLRAVLSQGDPEDQRKIFRRTIRSVTWLPDEQRLEIRLVLPRPRMSRPKGVWILYVPGVGFELPPSR
jgi:hypothetical protein